MAIFIISGFSVCEIFNFNYIKVNISMIASPLGRTLSIRSFKNFFVSLKKTSQEDFSGYSNILSQVFRIIAINEFIILKQEQIQ